MRISNKDWTGSSWRVVISKQENLWIVELNMEGNSEIPALDIVLCCLAALIHSIGIHLLYTIKEDVVQRCFLIHISSSEMVLTLLTFVTTIAKICNLPEYIEKYAWIARESCTLPLYGCLSLLTLERFLQEYLHLKYSNSWFERNKKHCCFFTWLIAAISVILVFFWGGGLQEVLSSYHIIELNASLVNTVLLHVRIPFMESEKASIRRKQISNHSDNPQEVFTPTAHYRRTCDI